VKRFYESAQAVREGEGWAIKLDGRPVRTPARAPLIVPGEALGLEIAAEWETQDDRIDPATMPMTGFANASIDRILPALDDFRAQIAAYGASDLFCYRADEPPELVARQSTAWDKLLDWARGRYAIDFTVTAGIMPVTQPAKTLARLRDALDALDPWLLAGAAVLTQIGGSLIGTLAHLDGMIDAPALFEAVSLDENWQAEIWGEDEEAAARLAARRADFLGAARYCALVLA